MGDNHQHQNRHGVGGCNCQSSNREVHQTIDEMEFERGIWTAAMENDLNRVEKFIRGGKVNARDNFGYTALHYAARSGHVDVCQLLIRNGAEVDSKTRSGGVTPLQRAAMKGRLEVVRVLVEQGRADVRAQDVDGKTALHRAVEEGSERVVEYLLQRDKGLQEIMDNHQRRAKDWAEEKKDEGIMNLFTREEDLS